MTTPSKKSNALPPQPPKPEADPGPLQQTPTPFVSSQPEQHAETTTRDGVDVAITAEGEVVPVHPTNPNPTNLGGIIDRDFVGTEREPVYAFAGTINGENVYDCDQSGALVRESMIPAHNRWIGLVNGVLNYNGVQT